MTALGPASVTIGLVLVAALAAMSAAAVSARARVMARLERPVSVASSPAAFDRRWVLAVVTAAAVGEIAGGVALAVVCGLGAACGPVVLLRVPRGRRERLADASLPLALETMARSLRAGSSLRQVVAEAGVSSGPPVGDDLAEIAAVAARGVPLVDALDRWAQRRPSPAVRLAAAALALAAEAGGTQARAVDGVASTLRERLAVEAEIRALSSQARLSAVVIAIAPLAFGLLTAATDPRPARFLLGSGPGWACLAGGLGLDALAAYWMAHLTRGAL